MLRGGERVVMIAGPIPVTLTTHAPATPATAALLSVAFVSLLSLVGALFLLVRRGLLARVVPSLVAFATGALLGDAFFHLLPETAEEFGFTAETGGVVIAGVVGAFLLERFLFRHEHALPGEADGGNGHAAPGHRHGHASAHDDGDGPPRAVADADDGRGAVDPARASHTPHARGAESAALPYMILAGDCVHNALDGVIIAASYLVSVPVGVASTVAIALHELPQELGDFGVLVYGGFAVRTALVANFLTALTAFAGATVVLFVLDPEGLLRWLLPLAAGNFVYVAAADLLPELKREPPAGSRLQLAAFFAGLVVLYLLTFLE